MTIEDENRKLREELKLQKQSSFQTIMSWRTRYAKTQETLQTEIEARDKQLRDIAASLILLESQLQKERKKMANEMTEKDRKISDLQTENARLSDSDKTTYANAKPSPITQSVRKSRRATSEDRHGGRKTSSDRERSRKSGQVVIERRSREKRMEKNINSDSSEEDLLKKKSKSENRAAQIPPAQRKRPTRSMREPSPISKNVARSDRGSTSSSSDEPFDYLHIQSMPRLGMKKSSTLPARCDPSLLNQWAKNELEQGIII